MKIGWVTYAIVMACALPLATTRTVSSQAGATQHGDIQPFDGSTTGSSGPPLPTCGAFVRDETYGPITVSQYWSQGCANVNEDLPYLQQSLKKTKHIYQNGSTWECPVSPLDDAQCAAFQTSNCPSATCVK